MSFSNELQYEQDGPSMGEQYEQDGPSMGRLHVATQAREPATEINR
jgi:hypothetical protein